MRRLPHTKKLGEAILDAVSPIIARASTEEREDVGARIMGAKGERRIVFNVTPML